MHIYSTTLEMFCNFRLIIFDLIKSDTILNMLVSLGNNHFRWSPNLKISTPLDDNLVCLSKG